MNKTIKPLTVVVSTKKKDKDYLGHLKRAFSHPKTEFLIYENVNQFSLPEIYNRGISESKNDIIVFMHDDLIIETPNITPKINDLFKNNSDYGIIGIAGTDNLTNGIWWNDRNSMFGIVGHIHNGKRHVNHYSPQKFIDNLKNVVVVDGLFIMVNKNNIKSNFNEEFKGFHFYDISFCVDNFLKGVKIGVTTKISITHKSIGITNNDWDANRFIFETCYKKYLPIKIN
jgi:hypothetical protein